MYYNKVWAVFKRDLIESLSHKSAFLFELGCILASLLTFFFIAKILGNTARPYLEGYGGAYFPFVLIGLALTGYQLTGQNSFARSLTREIEDGTLEAILVTPTHLSAVVLSGSLWNLVSTSVRLFTYLSLGAVFFGIDLSRMNFPAVVASVFLTITSLAGLGILSAGLLLIFKQGSPVNGFLNGAAKFFSGVYFPITVLPGWLHGISFLIPLTYSLEALRGAILGGKGILAISGELTVLAIFSAILLPCGILFFTWAVQRTKREGSLILQ
jgi:ABC-2 type transport system permease protein